MIRKAYSFSARVLCETTQQDVDALCVFFDTKRDVSQLDFFDELTIALQSTSVLPDCVVVISDIGRLGVLHEHWTASATQRETFLERGKLRGVPFVKGYYFLGWSPAGISLLHTCDVVGPNSYALPLDSLNEQGLQALIVNNPVVQIAPAGHVFNHPSRTVNKLFIQARELATSEAELAFVGRCLVGKMPVLREPSLAQVYIDTMGIYSIVREALTFCDSPASVNSFHSYGELSELSPPTAPYAVVISASTSGGMGRRLHTQQGFAPQRLMTLIDASRYERSGAVLVALNDVDRSYAAHIADGTETQIEIFGEHFASKAKPPRAVTLGLPHTPKCLRDFLSQFGIQGTQNINSVTRGSAATRIICANSDVVGADPRLHTWLSAEIDWKVSAAVDHVVHANDAGSKAIADAAANRLQLAKGAPTRPPVIPYSSLSQATIQAARGVLVVQALVGDGGLLREVSRDLREYVGASVPRHFLVGLALPQSDEAWTRLQQFLVKNSTPREYGFSAWLSLSVGADGAATAWQAYSELAAQAQVDMPSVPGVPAPVVATAIDLAVQKIEKSFNGFLPRSDGEPLGLTDGFLFFSGVFDGRLADVPTSTTFATVASVLQAARDLSNPTNQLRSTGYESVALSPENFLRFNDNLLQACILRAAHPSELDYSSSPQLSGLMKEFLLKVFSRHQHPYGAAALEFAAALATNRLRLATKDKKNLLEEAIPLLAGAPSPLLGLLCLVR